MSCDQGIAWPADIDSDNIRDSFFRPLRTRISSRNGKSHRLEDVADHISSAETQSDTPHAQNHNINMDVNQSKIKIPRTLCRCSVRSLFMYFKQNSHMYSLSHFANSSGYGEKYQVSISYCPNSIIFTFFTFVISSCSFSAAV